MIPADRYDFLRIPLDQPRPTKGPIMTDPDFTQFCRQATDNQLANIIQKEHQARRYSDRNDVENVARIRGWDEGRIKEARTSGGAP